MESKHISILFLYSKTNVCELLVFVYVVVKYNFTITVSQLEQPSCLIAWVYLGQKLYLDEWSSSL